MLLTFCGECRSPPRGCEELSWPEGQSSQRMRREVQSSQRGPGGMPLDTHPSWPQHPLLWKEKVSAKLSAARVLFLARGPCRSLRQPRQLLRVLSCDKRRELTVCSLLLGSMGFVNDAASMISDWLLISTDIVHEHALRCHCLRGIDVAVRKGYGLISFCLSARYYHWQESRRIRPGTGRRCYCKAHC